MLCSLENFSLILAVIPSQSSGMLGRHAATCFGKSISSLVSGHGKQGILDLYMQAGDQLKSTMAMEKRHSEPVYAERGSIKKHVHLNRLYLATVTQIGVNGKKKQMRKMFTNK